MAALGTPASVSLTVGLSEDCGEPRPMNSQYADPDLVGEESPSGLQPGSQGRVGTCPRPRQVQKLDCSPGPGLLQPLQAVCPPTEERTDSGRGWGSERRGLMLSRQHHPRPTRKHPSGEGNAQESRDSESGHFSPTNLGQVTLGLRFLMHKMWDWGSMLSRDLHSFIQQIFIQSLPLAWHCPTLEDII